MPRTKTSTNSGNNGNRQEHIAYMKENCPEGTVLHLIYRGSPLVISAFRLYLDGAGEPKIECLDLPVATILGYKLKDEQKLEGIQIMASQDAEMTGDFLAMSLSKYIFSEYGKYS